MLSDEEMQCTPPEIVEAANVVVSNLVPTKSSTVYYGVYQKFVNWCEEKHVNNYSENVLLVYFFDLANVKKMKCSSMWSHYSMIRSLLNIKHGIDISKYLKLRAYLKKQNERYIPKKSRMVLIFGVFGGCRCDELVKMKVDDVQDAGALIHVTIPKTKTNKNRLFTIVGDNVLKLVRKYVSLRPKGMEDRRFFLKYQNGRCYRAVMGIHTIGTVSREVASFLKLPNWKEYTGHCLRRTSATFLVDGGADITCLKRHGGWKSNSVAEGYIEDSLANKKEIAMKIFAPSSEPSSSTSNSETCPSEQVMDRNDSGPATTICSSRITTCEKSCTTTGCNFQHASFLNCSFNFNCN